MAHVPEADLAKFYTYILIATNCQTAKKPKNLPPTFKRPVPPLPHALLPTLRDPSPATITILLAH